MNAKAEVVEALDTLYKMLDSPEPLTGLRRDLARTTLIHAQVRMQHLTDARPRKAKAAPEKFCCPGFEWTGERAHSPECPQAQIEAAAKVRIEPAWEGQR